METVQTMSRQWTVQSVVRALVIVLAALPVPVLIADAASAAGPSVGLPEITPVPVQQQLWAPPRPEDEAARRALRNDQGSRTIHPGSGTPTATSLAPSATWEVSGHTGDFTWSYPLRVPPAAGGLAPDLALSYRSSTVDGRTSVTNNQPSWIGDGWDLSPGYIERTYWGCADDDVQTGDLCWRSNNATATYGGRGGMLICCDGSGKWRAKNDDGARIERLSGAANGDEGGLPADRGEHWKITTVEGTQYWFGSQADSQSTWTVPVFGDDAGEPCHGGSFETSSCKQAWRWNLDKVVDRHGNVIRYFYEVERNKYGMNMKDAAVSYDRGGTLHHIDYGLHETVGGAAGARVDFAVADRCVPGSVCVLDRKDNWPDTALDNRCEAVTCTKHAPTFWSTKRLATITTSVRRASGLSPVDRWELDQLYPDPGDGEKPALWLKSIKHTGLVNGSLALPLTTFEGHQMPNRVYAPSDGFAMLNRYRITGIVSESGGWTSVNYQAADCRQGSLPADAWTNEMRCFPVQWAPEGHEPRTHHFHKYVVASIIQSDAMSSSTQQVVEYEYLDGAGWHWDTSEFVKEDKKTWNEFRGFKRVRIRTGAPQDRDPGRSPMALTEQRFYRGMNGDKFGADKLGVRSATVSDSVGGTARADDDWLQGFGFETTVYEGDASPVVSRTVIDPVVQGPTATRDSFKAYIVGAGVRRDFTALKPDGWRETKTVTEYDDRGLPKKVNDLGDTGQAADDRCTTTTYARNDGSWVLDRPATVKTVAVNCDTTARFPEHAIVASRFSYDGNANLTKTEIASAWTSADPDYATTATARYDVHGRATETTDAMGRTSRIEFTPATGGPVTGTKTTSPATVTLPGGLVTTTTLEPAFGEPSKVVDPNDRTIEIAYDALGRVSKVWLPDRPREPRDGEPGNPKGSIEFSYQVRRDAPSVVTTSKVGPNGIHVSSNTLFDGLLRPRQVQTPAVGMDKELKVPVEEGRLIVDTRYDSHGRAYKTTQPYFNSAAVDTTLWVASDTEVPGLTRTRFDGAGRAVESVYQAGAIDKWRTVMSYDGDRVHTTSPAGGTATTVISDARGQTTELRQYHAPTPDGAYDSTRYRYTLAGQLAEVIGPDGARWRYGYDLRGRKTTAEDPDAGTSTMGYNNTNQLTSISDARGATLAYAYDELGRRTAVHRDSLTGPMLAQWTYDTVSFGKGLPATSTRFAGPQRHAYTTSVDYYTALSKPLATSVTIPAVEGSLAGTYTTWLSYGADGSLTGERYPAAGDPAAGGLGEETVSYLLDNWGRPTSTRTAVGVQLVANTLYTRYGETERLEHGSRGSRAWQTFLYETSTRRPNRIVVDAEVPAPIQADLHYTHDAAGNITSIADVIPGQTGGDVQCFRHDQLRRLTEAWTPDQTAWSENDGCLRGPGEGGLHGPAPYWHSYEYSAGGNRTRETQRSGATSTTRTYAYPTSGSQPHTLRTVSGPAGTETLDYNAAGQTTRRARPGTEEIFNWDVEGHLESAVNTTTNQTTSFVYAADGSRLLRRDPAATTLYLGNQEIRLAAGATRPTVTRYYTHGGKVIAMRERGGALTWLAGDHQGTSQVAIDTSTMTTTRRRQLPFGAPRGVAPSWPGERGFVGGALDASTGLTHLGAREYDPTTGRFISVDPVMDPADPQQMNGYAYANNNPLTFSDASGLWLIGGEDNQGNQYGISYGNNGSATTIGSQKAVDGEGTNRPPPRSGCGGRGNCGRRDGWTKQTTPKTDDRRSLLKYFGNYMLTASDDLAPGNYWFPQQGDDVICFGRFACMKAYQELIRNPDNVQGAKDIAANYCLDNFDECRERAETYYLGKELLHTYTQVMYGVVVRGAPIRGAGPAASAPAVEMVTAGGVSTPRAALQEMSAYAAQRWHAEGGMVRITNMPQMRGGIYEGSGGRSVNIPGATHLSSGHWSGRVVYRDPSAPWQGIQSFEFRSGATLEFKPIDVIGIYIK